MTSFMFPGRSSMGWWVYGTLEMCGCGNYENKGCGFKCDLEYGVKAFWDELGWRHSSWELW